MSKKPSKESLEQFVDADESIHQELFASIAEIPRGPEFLVVVDRMGDQHTTMLNDLREIIEIIKDDDYSAEEKIALIKTVVAP